MLTQLVRPLVRTQIQILANSKAAGGRLVNTISNWLGYLGVQAEVKHLQTKGDRIQVSLSVGKPEQCSEAEWKQILSNLDNVDSMEPVGVEMTYQMMTPSQQRQACRLLAHIIQVGNPNALQEWDRLKRQLMGLSMDSELLQNIQVALKVPQRIDSLLVDLEPDVAAFVLSRAIGIALIDKKISVDEDTALKSIYSALGNSVGAPN
ncbi:MAG: hypothetical protein VKL39_05355 [Leptolyngbyaceae bacterium]|nr:hypothetical protein [Leptolyngbyaceae bacterium]